MSLYWYIGEAQKIRKKRFPRWKIELPLESCRRHVMHSF